MLLDIHTHHLPPQQDKAMISVCMHNGLPIGTAYFSAGIHPWFLTEEDFPHQQKWLEKQLEDPRILALGEAGLDKRCNTPYHLQQEAFIYIGRMAEKHHLPLIIHAVKSYNDIMALKKEIKPSAAWIIHGFRGKKELAENLLKQGFYLSFGEKFQTEALQTVPNHRLLLETDESETPIEEIYQQAAALRNTDVNSLQESLHRTINNLFFNR